MLMFLYAHYVNERCLVQGVDQVKERCMDVGALGVQCRLSLVSYVDVRASVREQRDEDPIALKSPAAR